MSQVDQAGACVPGSFPAPSGDTRSRCWPIPDALGQQATRGKVRVMAVVARKHKRQATLPGAGPAPAPHSKAPKRRWLFTQTTECPPAPPVRPFSQELEMTWTTPEKRCVHPNHQAASRSPSLCQASQRRLGKQHPLPEQRFSHFWWRTSVFLISRLLRTDTLIKCNEKYRRDVKHPFSLSALTPRWRNKSMHPSLSSPAPEQGSAKSP